ncbi:MFS transporter permease [Macrococcus hajekii]|uniref:MFS transporter permease n=1 Tax=Macrococcus hajekii TaxID=198482 RepID=A0A4R6BJU1_9STAP|nr:MFS transporter permease [Macrococcus hajekii]TDM01989.1 MFS transporter permease [Macrococcus hajekii]GGB09092.1 hypothetical protein GCM10007190_16450 [Macrococcus hajekii]
MLKKFILIIFTIIAIALLAYTSITQNGSQKLLMTFLTLGFGLALLRLFVNHSIKKMKGKSMGRKLLFFAILLSIGLPVQYWFRTRILMTIDQEYLASCITILISGMVIMT